MSQLFLVSGPNTEELIGLWQRALRLFTDMSKLSPRHCVERQGLRLALFDAMARPGSVGLLKGENEAFCAGVGSWFSRGVAQGDLGLLMQAADRDEQQLIEALNQYDGFFAFVVAARERLHVITDPVGRLHLYECRIGTTLLVSTSALALAALTGASWNAVAVREFLALGYVLGEHSLFQGVHKLGPATVSTQGLTVWRAPRRRVYWRISDWVYDGAEGAGGVPALAEALCTSMRSIFDAYPRPAMDLTGGFDSRALLGAALRDYPVSRFETVVSGQPTSGDVVAARGIADGFGLTHRELAPQPRDARQWWELAQQAVSLVDGEYDVLEYACILNIHSGLAAEFDASINGSGGETCRGYWWELLLPFLGRRGHFDPLHVAAARFATDEWAEALLAEEFGETLDRHMGEMISEADTGLDKCLNTARMDNIYLTVRMQRWQGRIASATSRLWPCFSPFLMKGPLQAAVGATVRERLADRMPRRLIHDFDSQLAALPMASGMPASPITWANAYRFYRLPALWGGRVWRKASRMVGGGSKSPSHSGPSAVRLFWDHAPFRDWWTRPLTEELYREGALKRFMQQSQERGFTGTAHFGRVVTLELVARALQTTG